MGELQPLASFYNLELLNIPKLHHYGNSVGSTGKPWVGCEFQAAVSGG